MNFVFFCIWWTRIELNLSNGWEMSNPSWKNRMSFVFRVLIWLIRSFNTRFMIFGLDSSMIYGHPIWNMKSKLINHILALHCYQFSCLYSYQAAELGRWVISLFNIFSGAGNKKFLRILFIWYDSHFRALICFNQIFRVWK